MFSLDQNGFLIKYVFEIGSFKFIENAYTQNILILENTCYLIKAAKLFICLKSCFIKMVKNLNRNIFLKKTN